MKNISNNTIVTGIAALIVGLVIGWFIGHAGVSKTMTTDYQANDSTGMEVASTSDMTGSMNDSTSMMNEGEGAILVSDQAAGAKVTVASVEAGDAVWVTVREDRNGDVGNILGATRVESGASNNIVIDLLRPTQAGRTYHVVLFKDDGDKMFNFKADMPLMSNGVLISQTFKAQ